MSLDTEIRRVQTVRGYTAGLGAVKAAINTVCVCVCVCVRMVRVNRRNFNCNINTYVLVALSRALFGLLKCGLEFLHVKRWENDVSLP